MKITTALIVAAVVLSVGACEKQGNAGMNAESTPAASPQPGMAPESAATPATAPESTAAPADTSGAKADTGAASK